MIGMGITGLHAQDTMVTKSGDIKTVYSVEISSSAVFYKSSDAADAQIERIAKEDLFMIKRPDGTMYDLGNNPATATPTTVAQPVQAPQLSDEVSEEASRRNREVIESINSYVPKYEGKVGKECKRVFCVMGIGEGSSMVNDEVELSMVIAAPKINESFNYCNPMFILSVKNKTAETLYIDLGNTFFVRGGENTTAYYVPSATSTSSTTGSGVSVNAGAVAGALGIGGGLGKLASGVNVGGGSSSTSVNVTYSQRLVAVPPMSSKTLDGQPLFLEEGSPCDGLRVTNYSEPMCPWFFFRAKKEDPEFEHGTVHTYSEDLSPLHFSVFLTYSQSEDCNETKRISSSLYLKNIIGIHPGSMVRNYFSCDFSQDIPKYYECIYFVGLNADGRFYFKHIHSVFPRP